MCENGFGDGYDHPVFPSNMTPLAFKKTVQQET